MLLLLLLLLLLLVFVVIVFLLLVLLSVLTYLVKADVVIFSPQPGQLHTPPRSSHSILHSSTRERYQHYMWVWHAGHSYMHTKLQ